jgi:hypothetical protein
MKKINVLTLVTMMLISCGENNEKAQKDAGL